MIPSSVRDYLQANRQQHLEKLSQLLRIPSVANLSDDKNGCSQCTKWLASHLEELGLKAEIMPTDGQDAVFATANISEKLPTLLIYGHYDVQPPDPLDQWTSKPFEPVVRDDAIYARGASDDKGQLFAQLMAIEAWQRAEGTLPVNLKILLEGEEEIGSPNFEPFIAAHTDLLAADAAVISDSEFFAPDLPSITYALRGLVCLELTLSGPAEDLHSGIHGGCVRNPLNALAAMIGQMHDAEGRVTIPGFYADCLALSDEERRQWSKLPFDADQYAASLGLQHRLALRFAR